MNQTITKIEVFFLKKNTIDLTIYSIWFILSEVNFFFLFFLVEELARVALAIYIIYLIIFDVHAVNCSYVEDAYFTSKRGVRRQRSGVRLSILFKKRRY